MRPSFLAPALGLLLLLAPFAEAPAASRAARVKAVKAAKAARAKKERTKKTPEPRAADPIAPDAPSDVAPLATGASASSRGPTRLDFDDRLIQGQTNKSGAVYLYDRKELQVRSMIRERESFRAETLSTIYDPERAR